MGNYGIDILQRLTPSVARYQQLADTIMQQLRVMLPAVVQSFNASVGTVDVLVATNEYVLTNANQDGSQISLQTQSMQLPLLQDVPVQLPGAGGWTMTFPIQPGDECMIVFADTPLDVWFQNGGLNNNPISQRRHNLSDAIAVFGIKSTPKVLEDYSTNSAQLRSNDGAVKIDLATAGITITAPEVTINTTGNVNLNADGTVNITGSSVMISSDTSIDGVVFLDHVHDGVAAGGANTGPVVP